MSRLKKSVWIVFRGICAFAAVMTMCFFGMALTMFLPQNICKQLWFIPFVFAAVIVIIVPAVNQISAAIYRRKKKMNVKQAQDFFLENKEQAQENLPKYMRKVKRSYRSIKLNSFFIFLLALATAFTGAFNNSITPEIFAAAVIYLLMGRIRFSNSREFFKNFVKRSQFPALHKLAHKAAKKVGVDGKIRMIFLSDCNAGIAKIGRTYSLQIGAVLLNIMTENELYNTLIHEFAHMSKQCMQVDKERKFYFYLDEREGNILNNLYTFCEMKFCFEYSIYAAASSVVLESMADKKMGELGEPQTAANALAKLNSYSLFENELENSEHAPLFEPEQPPEHYVSEMCAKFREAEATRRDFWKKLVENEIEARSASHPGLKNRMKILGVSDYRISFPDENSNYRNECRKALDLVDKQVYENNRATYEESRNEYYLKPLKTVRQWEENGRKIMPEEINDILIALKNLYRFSELEALCDEIIETAENQCMTALARYYKGCLLLARYDKAGIDHIYKAIELNENYSEEGVDMIGSFCCRMGLQKELDEYRERSLEIMNFEYESHSKAGTLNPSDNLTEENLPEGMLGEILENFKKFDENVISRVFLVKKIISESFSSSVFVIEFENGTSDEAVERIMNKIFNYLDTHESERQFSLFLYDSATASAVNKVKNNCVYSKN